MANPKSNYNQEIILDDWLNEIALLAASLQTVDVSGSANITLTSTQYRCKELVFTGALTGNINVIVPGDAGRGWWVQNGSSGSFSITVKTSGGAGIAVAQGYRAFLYCDGTDVLRLSPDVSNTGGLIAATVGPNASQVHTVPAVSSDTLALLAAAQTLTNKTIGAATISGNMTFADAINIILNATTGTKIGTATTQKLGFWNATPVVRPSAYTQTYSTADKTLSAYTPDAESGAYTGAADSEAKLVDLNALRVAYENLRAFTEDLAGVVNSLVDDLQAVGIVG